MNGYTEFRFSFNGELQPRRDEESPPDRVVLGRLVEEERRIIHELELFLEDEIADELGVGVRARAEISFREGSVLFGGFVILEVLATISGTIDLVEKTVKLIRRALRWVLGRRAGARRVGAHVVPLFSVAPTATSAASSAPNGQLFSLRTILLAITLLNAVIFIGGSVYTGVSVTSIQEKYEKAQKEIDRVRQDYDTYRAGLKERLGDIEGKLRETGNEVDAARGHAKKLSEDLTSIDAQAQQLNTSIATLRNRGAGWVSFKLAFHQANWILKLFLILIPAHALVFVGVVFFVALH